MVGMVGHPRRWGRGDCRGKCVRFAVRLVGAGMVGMVQHCCWGRGGLTGVFPVSLLTDLLTFLMS